MSATLVEGCLRLANQFKLVCLGILHKLFVLVLFYSQLSIEFITLTTPQESPFTNGIISILSGFNLK